MTRRVSMREVAGDVAGDLAEYVDLVVGEAVDDVPADGGDVPGGGGNDQLPAGVGEYGSRVAGVVGVGLAPQQTASFQAFDDVRQPGQRAGELTGQVAQAQGAAGCHAAAERRARWAG